MGKKMFRSHFVCHSSKLLSLPIKMFKPSPLGTVIKPGPPGDRQLQVHGREAALFVKLFPCPGSVALLASVSFQPLRCSKVVCGGFKE